MLDVGGKNVNLALAIAFEYRVLGAADFLFCGLVVRCAATLSSLTRERHGALSKNTIRSMYSY